MPTAKQDKKKRSTTGGRLRSTHDACNRFFGDAATTKCAAYTHHSKQRGGVRT